MTKTEISTADFLKLAWSKLDGNMDTLDSWYALMAAHKELGYDKDYTMFNNGYRVIRSLVDLRGLDHFEGLTRKSIAPPRREAVTDLWKRAIEKAEREGE